MWWTFELIITWTVVVQVVFGKDISILEYLVTSSFKLISSKWLSCACQRFSEKCWDKVRYMRSLCNDTLYSYKRELCVYYAWKRTSKILKSIYVYILNILRLHRIKISNLVHFFLTKTFMSIMRMLIYCKSLYILFWWACCSPLLSSFITQ